MGTGSVGCYIWAGTVCRGLRLWQGKRWAEGFAAVSAGIYIPFELYGLFEADTWFSFAALVINVFIVWLMVNALLRKHPVEANAA